MTEFIFIDNVFISLILYSQLWFLAVKLKAFSYFLLVLLLCVPIAGAVEITGAELYTAPNNYTVGDDLFTELSEKIEHYNQNFEKVPSVLHRFVGSEEIAGRIKLENGDDAKCDFTYERWRSRRVLQL